jgi:hypothetical protein
MASADLADRAEFLLTEESLESGRLPREFGERNVGRIVGCYGEGAGGVVAREVLRRRRSESPFDCRSRRRSKEIDVLPPLSLASRFSSERDRGGRVRRAERPGVGVKTARERAEEKRAEKLERVREQVESGSLVIRRMTDEERRRYPPVAPQPKRPGQL